MFSFDWATSMPRKYETSKDFGENVITWDSNSIISYNYYVINKHTIIVGVALLRTSTIAC